MAVVRNLACVPGARQAWIGISALSLSMGPQVTDLTLNDCFLIGQSGMLYIIGHLGLANESIDNILLIL